MQRPGWMAELMAAAYMRLESPTAARIVAVASDVAASVQIHRVSMAGGVMRIRRLDGLAYRRKHQ